jgi:hypothetical protein
MNNTSGMQVEREEEENSDLSADSWLGSGLGHLTRCMRYPVVLLLPLLLLYLGWIGYVLRHDKPLDFYLYYIASAGFAQGVDIYSLGADYGQKGDEWAVLARQVGVTNYAPPYRYPPLPAELIYPLTLLPPRIAAAVWLLVSAAAFVGAAWLLGRSSPLRWGKQMALLLMLGFVPPLTTLHAGQISGLLLLALAWGLASLPQSPLGAGAGVGAAVMLKSVPFAHLLYLGWRRQPRAFLVGVVTVLILMIASIPLIGVDGLLSFFRNLTAIGQPGKLFPTGSNQALSGLIARVLVGREAVGSGADVAELFTPIWAASSAALILATIGICWPIGDFKRLVRLEFSLITVAVCLITPYTWYHQLALLFIPLFVLVEEALTAPRLRWMLVPLALGYVTMGVHGLAWHHLGKDPVLLSMPLLSAVMFWIIIAWLILRLKLSGSEVAGE